MNPQFTNDISKWLALPSRSDDEIRHGAELLLAVNHDQSTFRQAQLSPRRMESFIAYRLRKILTVRLAGYTMAQVHAMDEEIMPQIEAEEKRRKAKPRKTAKAAQSDKSDNPAQRAAGRRPDHDKLPPEIQELWGKCAERWKKIVAWRVTLSTLTEPCDRFEYLGPLKKAFYDYLADMRAYDDYGRGQALAVDK